MKESNDILVLFESLNNHEVFTPPRLAKQMLELFPEDVWTHPEYKFLDPCVKSGVFLREMFYKLFDGLNGKGKFTADDGITYDLNDNHQRINHIFKNMLYGIATSELTGYVSRRTLYGVMEADSDKQIAAIESFERSKNFTDWTEQQRLDFIGRNQFNDYYDHTIFKTKEYEGFEKEGNIFYPTEEVTQKVAEEGNYLIEDTYFPFIDARTKHRKILDIKEQKMKFDVIIGNPPYQISTNGFGAQAKPIYHIFVEEAKKLNPKYMSFIIPARWFTGGMGLDDFRDKMIADRNISVLVDNPVLFDVFPAVEIKGGVCYFLRDSKHFGDCMFITKEKGIETSRAVRDIRDGEGVIIRQNEAISILSKIRNLRLPTVKDMVDGINPFDIPTNFSSFEDAKSDDMVYVKGRVESGYIARSKIKKNLHLIDLYKVITPKASDGHGRVPMQVLGETFVLDKKSVCTMTYIVCGAFNEKNEAQNYADYLQTKLIRFLISLRKSSQDNSKNVFGFVPKLDFSKKWTDKELYSFFNLNQHEIELIESNVKSVE